MRNSKAARWPVAAARSMIDPLNVEGSPRSSNTASNSMGMWEIDSSSCWQAWTKASPCVREAARAYGAIAERHGLTPAALALKFCASRWYVGSTIVAATKVEHLRENVAALLDGVPLGKEALAEIEAVHQRIRDPCRTD